MGRRGRGAYLPDHRAKVYEVRECVSKAEADAMWQKYGFRREGFDFHGALNYALSWRDTFLEREERPAKESIEILEAIHNAGTSLRAHLNKPGADKLLRPIMMARHLTDTDVLITLEARCQGWPAPAKRLRQSIGKASERLRDALEKAGYLDRLHTPLEKAPGCNEVAELLRHGPFPRGADLPHALDWWIQASAKAAKEIEGSTCQDRDRRDEMPRGRRKPTQVHHQQLLSVLWDLFLSADPRKADKIQWDRARKQYGGTFYEFAKEVASTAGIPLADTWLADLVKKLRNDKKTAR